MPRILIVDDSPTARLALSMALGKDPDIQVVGAVASGDQALRAIDQRTPDLLTMDVHLEGENGIRVTARIMASRPVPILIVTGRDPTDAELVYQALEAGALDVCGKLPAPSDPSYPASHRRLIRLVKTLARVPVVRHRASMRSTGRNRADRQPPVPDRPDPTGPRMVVMGASTGGPPLIAHLLRQLPNGRGLPFVLVQHLSTGFGSGFARWLDNTTGQRVELVDRYRELDRAGVYIAQPDTHLIFASNTAVTPSDNLPRGFQRPSIDVLFDSAARTFGAAAVGILLTGMGQDGAAGLESLHRAGATTIAQRPDTCVVGSMPQAAMDRGVVDLVLSPERIGAWLVDICAPPRRE